MDVAAHRDVDGAVSEAVQMERLRERTAAADETYQVAAKSLLLAREAEPFLAALVPAPDAESLANAWRQAGRRAAMALAHERPNQYVASQPTPAQLPHPFLLAKPNPPFT